MNNIDVAKYIAHLLYNHNSVIVPGLGTFSTRELSAVINEDEGTVEPPRKTIDFNESLRTNDNLLAGYIARAASITEANALQQVNKFVNNLQADIEAGAAITFDNIGTFKKDEGNILFEAEHNSNYNLLTYGLSEVSLYADFDAEDEEVDSDIEKGYAPIVSEERNIQTSAPPLSNLIEETNEIEEEVENDLSYLSKINSESGGEKKQSMAEVLAESAKNLKEQKESIPTPLPPPSAAKKDNNKWWLWLLPIAILGLLLFLVFQLLVNKPDNSNRELSTDNNTPTAITDNNSKDNDNYESGTTTNERSVPQDGAAINDNMATNNDTDNATADNANGSNSASSSNSTTDDNSDKGNNLNAGNSNDANTNTANDTNTNATTTLPPSGTGYYVVVRLFNETQNAENLASKLRQENFNAMVIPKGDGRYRVGVFTANKGEANRLKNELGKRFEGTWILTK